MNHLVEWAPLVQRVENKMDIRKKIENLIREVLKELGLESFSHTTDLVESKGDVIFGDYSTNIVLTLGPVGNEDEILNRIKDKVEDIKEIEKVEPKLSFINFYLSRDFFTDRIKFILEQGDDWGKNDTGKNNKFIVEYSSPNIAKPFTVGHLRSTIIGDSIARILSFSGYKVIRDNHLGDWGTQFGKLIVAIKKWGDLKEVEKSDTPIKELVNLYVKFHDESEKTPELEDEARAWFAKLENKDNEATDIWKRCVDLSKKEFERIYEKLNITPFDTSYGESFFEDKMQSVIDDVKSKNLGKESEGAFIIEFPEEKKLPPLLLLKKDGSSLYALRDLATDKWRKEEYGDDIKIINQVGSEQTEYFKQIFEAEKMLGYFSEGQRYHVAHGLYRFQDGKMSTRKGNVIWLDDIIQEVERRAGAINEETKEIVAIGALKFNDLKRDSLKDIVFDWEEILNIKGDSGAYLQYAAVRANSILEKAKKFDSNGKDKIPEEIIDLERMLHKFEETIVRSTLKPHYISTYLIKISREFNTFYFETKILDDKNECMNYHLDIVKAFYQTMKNGLWLLGIETPEKM